MTSTSAAFGKAADEYFRIQSAAAEDLRQARDRNASTMVAVTIGVFAFAILLIASVWYVLDRIVVRPLGEAASALGHVARGNLATRLPAASGNEIGKLFSALGDMQRSLTGIVGGERSGTDSMVTGVRELAGGNSDLSARTEQQAASLQETASSMEQLTATGRQNTESARQARQLASQASATAQRGGVAVEPVIGNTTKISERSGQSVRN